MFGSWLKRLGRPRQQPYCGFRAYLGLTPSGWEHDTEVFVSGQQAASSCANLAFSATVTVRVHCDFTSTQAVA